MPTQTEIERRFLVTNMDSRVTVGPCAEIVQGYVDKSLRVRTLLDQRSGVQKAYLTAKSGKGLIRTETTEEISLDAAQLLLKSTSQIVYKSRFYKDDWEVDVFSGNLIGLTLAEKELKAPDEVCSLPSWIHSATEVTQTLTNRQLAKISALMEEDTTLSPVEDLLMQDPFRIVLTGAPCSGKSTALRRLREEMTSAHCIPEIATIVMGQVGIVPSVGMRTFQNTVRQVQLSFEEGAIKQARKDGKIVVILDRGTLDSAAFMSYRDQGGLGLYERIMRTTDVNEYSRYDAVLLLALPSKEVYDRECSNNPVRTETYEQSVRVQNELINVWSGHKNLVIVDDAPTWEEKYTSLRKAIDDVIYARG